MLTWINRLENWYEDHKSNYLLLPLTAAVYLLLVFALIITNVAALIRWPFAALARTLRKSDGRIESQNQTDDNSVIEGNPDLLNKILEARELVLIDFWAEWCGPCILMNKPLKRLSESDQTNCTIVKIDTMKHGKIAESYGVKGLPTLLLFKNNREAKRHAGALTYHELLEFVND